MPTRPTLKAETRNMIGKKVGRLRRAGILPATVYGHNVDPVSIQVNAHAFGELMRKSGISQLIDLQLDTGPVRPVLIRQMGRDAKRNAILHVEFFQANLLERMTSHVPIHLSGESPAVREGGILLSVLDHVDIECLPQDVPAAGIDVDLSGLEEINAAIHARDLVMPEGVTMITAADEVIVKVSPPTAEEVVDEVLDSTEPLPAELGGDQSKADSVPEA